MKKWTSIAVGLLAAISITACGSNSAAPQEAAPAAGTGTATQAEALPTAQELIEKVASEGANLKSFHMQSSINQDMKITAGENTQDQKLNMTIDMDYVGEPLGVYSEIVTEMPGVAEKTTMKQYITEKAAYMENAGTWMKLPDATITKLVEQMKAQGNPEEQLKQLSSILDEVNVSEKDGQYFMEAKISGDNVKALAEKFLSQSGAADEQLSAMLQQMNLKSMEISYLIDKKTYFPLSSTVKMQMDMSMDGQSLDMSMAMDATFSKLNEVEAISIPQEVIDSAQ
ncbi:DUF6612 family protein [Paenibacillus massiliensis]|uniref:DUF6612 family protein n=1 Tax=Paenibacillus massiliensis TaxID=225917 RepID=UPI000370E538|nr:DUF6612 family protein [Paenibacillus massiliensis]